LRARKPNHLGGSPSSGRIGLAVLLATVAAFLVVGVAQAAAATSKVTIEGNGSGTVKHNQVVEELEKRIVCSGPPNSGVCEETVAEEFDSFFAVPAPGSELAGWVVTVGFPGLYCDGSAEEKEGAEEQKKANPGEFEGSTGICIPVEEGGGLIETTAIFCEEGTAQGWGEPCEEPKPKCEGTCYKLNVNIEEGEGTVVSNPAGIECEPTCSAEFKEGEKVTLTASPAAGNLFKSWKNCDTVNGRQCTVTMTEEKTVGAKFIPAYSLEGSKTGGLGILNTSPGGVNCGYACNSSTALYKAGSVTVKSKAAKHFHFVKFQGGTGSATSCNGSEEPTCTFTIGANSAIEEVYAPDAKSTLSLAKEGGGQGFVKTKPTNINCGYTCTAAEAEFYAAETAVPVSVKLNKGTTSVTWVKGAGTCTGTVETTESSCTVDMSSSHELVAKFE